MKKYIDYLFWKRTWFRVLFILLPTLAIALVLCVNHFFGKIFDTNKTMMVIYFILFILAMVDNKNVDTPENPFKKIKDEK
jgi:hypothetical protein